MVSRPIYLRNVVKTFGKIVAVKNVSFNVSPGDILGYVGPNGAGKTTTLRLILGLLEPTNGEVCVFGHDSHNLPVEIKKNIGVVLETDGIYPYITAEENLRFYGRVYGLSDSYLENRVEEMLKFVDLYKRKDDNTATFSRGMKRRLAFARAFLPNPSLLLCDELTAGLDPEQQRVTRNLIKKIADKQGVTVFFSSHNLFEVQEICNKVGILTNGRLLEYGEISEISKKHSRIYFSCKIRSREEIGKAVKILSDLNLDYEKQKKRELKIILRKEDLTSTIISRFSEAGIHLEEVRKDYPTIDKLYFEIVEKDRGEKNEAT